MKDLIPISKTALNGAETQTVDCRALHAFLESRQDFSTWFKARVEKYGFVEGIDFIALHNLMERGVADGGANRTDYALTLDMAKQLAMVENNEKGKQARLYFIECERIALEAAKPAGPRRSDVELNARSAAISFRMLARMNVYPQTMRAVFAAKSAALLTGEPLANLLPPVLESRETWLSPTALGELLSCSAFAVGRSLKAAGLHGENDPNHEWSQPLWDKSRYSNKEVVSYVYNPAVVLPALKSALGSSPEFAIVPGS